MRKLVPEKRFELPTRALRKLLSSTTVNGISHLQTTCASVIGCKYAESSGARTETGTAREVRAGYQEGANAD